MTSTLNTRQFARLRATRATTREVEWRAFYSEYFEFLCQLVSRFGVEAGEVEDLTQQVFIVAHRKILSGEDIEFPKAWLRSITVRVVSDRRRWHKVRQVKRWILETTARVEQHKPITPEESVSHSQLQTRVGGVLRRLSPKLRDVLVLCDIEECSISEAAECLKIPVNTVRSRRRLARESFQSFWLQEEGEA